MAVCPNCNHHNPDGATQCEACYTPLPMTTSCPNCGAAVQTDATFCGQCGFSLEPSQPGSATTPPSRPDPDPAPAQPSSQESSSPTPDPDPVAPLAATVVSPEPSQSNQVSSSPPTSPPVSAPLNAVASPPPPAPAPSSGAAKTQLQQQAAGMLHVQTNTKIELPPDLPVIHLGKPNEQIPPDIDVSGFPNSEIVSRVHADIRVEGDAYYIEDVGSANGTYVNHNVLLKGNRHRLRTGDRISLGKGDLMTFLFQLS